MDRYTEDTPLGRITISENEGKITSLEFNSEKEDTGCTETLAHAFRQLGEYLNGGRTSFDLELDPDGTDFQKDVWRGLLRIPYGRTVSYADLALMIGRPNSQRAVGNANGRNPIPIFIPCHRVIRSDGTIGGYSSGPGIKRRLLELEGSMESVKG